jgi:hypothetical protein
MKKIILFTAYLFVNSALAVEPTNVITDQRYIAGNLQALMDLEAKGEAKRTQRYGWQVMNMSAIALAGYRAVKISFYDDSKNNEKLNCVAIIEFTPSDQNGAIDQVYALPSKSLATCRK